MSHLFSLDDGDTKSSKLRNFIRYETLSEGRRESYENKPRKEKEMSKIKCPSSVRNSVPKSDHETFVTITESRSKQVLKNTREKKNTYFVKKSKIVICEQSGRIGL